MYGYLDESGTPGVSDRVNDFLVASLVIFKNEEMRFNAERAINVFRKNQNLPDGYEFHYSRNSTKARDAFSQFIKKLDFKFVTVAIRKTGSRDQASYVRLTSYLLSELPKHGINEISIIMDNNPIFHKRIKEYSKSNFLKISCRQQKSKNNNLIQLADYVTAIGAKKAKDARKSYDLYKNISKKQLAYLEI